MRPLVYLDHNASTPLRAEVAAAMAEALVSVHGNPSSTHAAGRHARACVEDARRDVATLMGVQAEEIVFTSGGTEGDNLAIRGLALAARARRGWGPGRGHIVSSPLEHPAVAGALRELEREGFVVTLVPVSPRGEIDPADVKAALRDDTVLVTLATANHELGNRFPTARLAAVAHDGGALFHTDAVAAAGKIALALGDDGVDAATVSAHKLGGPKGTGAIFVRQGVTLHSLVAGGHQERERRAGTENVAAVVGFGVAARLALAELDTVAGRLDDLRADLERRLLAIEGARLHGAPDGRVPGTTNVAFSGAVGQLVAINLDLEGICVSTGAACTSGSLAPSPVLRALGLTASQAAEGVRISLGRSTTAAEIDRIATLLPGIVQRLRQPRRVTGAARSRQPDDARARIVVAMSGGVDSSTAADLLLESGVDVVGVTLKLYDASGTAA
ncbi:MAG TPA: aminotransferase class V-fold PLP-dependent enzyme, partial [Polyangia bacterium]|nr:aminotransferase class V-fold PLP-dependent enzyme [Polyangia bacterium]